MLLSKYKVLSIITLSSILLLCHGFRISNPSSRSCIFYDLHNFEKIHKPNYIIQPIKLGGGCTDREASPNSPGVVRSSQEITNSKGFDLWRLYSTLTSSTTFSSNSNYIGSRKKINSKTKLGVLFLNLGGPEAMEVGY